MIPSKYIQKLRSELAGSLLESGDPGYDQSLVIDNGRIDLRPGVVAMCANAQDVITAYVACRHDASPCAGGAQRCRPRRTSGLVIDSNMNAKHLDADRQVC